jgi:hypothetical protein
MCLFCIDLPESGLIPAAVPKECGRESRLSELGWNACWEKKMVELRSQTDGGGG